MIQCTYVYGSLSFYVGLCVCVLGWPFSLLGLIRNFANGKGKYYFLLKPNNLHIYD